MKKGDIVFIKGNSLISKVIRKVDKMRDGADGKYSHVAIAVSDKHLIEAEYSSRISIVRLDSLVASGKIEEYNAIDLKISGDERESLYEASMTHIGKSYDYLQILSFVINKVFGFGLINSKSRFICSELVVSAMSKAGLLKGYDTDMLIDMSPNELYEFMEFYQSRP